MLFALIRAILIGKMYFIVTNSVDGTGCQSADMILKQTKQQRRTATLKSLKANNILIVLGEQHDQTGNN